MAARLALRQFNLSTVEDNLRWALRLDPAFGLARADLLPMLRGLGRADELATVAKALVADDDGPSGPVLTEHARLHLDALMLVAADRRAEAIPKLHAILDRYPFDVDAADLLMAVRADGATRDFQEVETIARRQLALAPRLETPASRLIRVLGTRNRAAEADALFRTLGLDRADPTLEDLFAELDLFAGRFTDASRGFTKAFATEPGNLYAEHMAIAAELLGGRCDKAAGLALDRIERKKLLGKDALLGWTYSLAVQALVCWEQWDGLEQVLTRWAAHDDSGRDQAFGMRERALFTRARILPVAARPARLAELEARWTRMLDARSVIPTNTRGQIENLVLQVTRDRTRLERLLAVAEHDASDLNVPAVQRSDGRLRVARLRGRLALLGVSAPGGTTAPAPAPTSVLEHYDDAVLDWSDVHGEGDTSARVEGLSQRADAATALASRASHPEDAARFAAKAEADWRAIVALGYPRLWVTDLWVVARHRLDEARRP
ncbi:MAG: hypothetical protein JNJ59_24800 [Deltaproteobacteria bacterium]|nr:hypothetical protein [Deltaproteobacteria bacterium]